MNGSLFPQFSVLAFAEGGGERTEWVQRIKELVRDTVLQFWRSPSTINWHVLRLLISYIGEA
jgi:hypothetical protein